MNESAIPPLLASVRPASALTTRPVDWLWPGRLGLGKLALLDGDPGLGKSFVALDLCARVSTGRPMPDGGPGGRPRNALVLNAEDGAEDTIRPRLQALGADLDRVFLPPLTRDDADAPLGFPAGAGLLDDALRRTQARLVVLDPVVAFLDPSVTTGSDQSVRRALFPLARLAEEHGAAVVLVRHLNKRGGGRSLYRGGGSIGFAGACRSVWLIARDPLRPDRCVLAQVKNNLAPPQPSLAYALTAPATGPPTLTWHGPTCWTADQLLAAGTGAEAPQRNRATDFLTTFLAAGPRMLRDVWEAAREHDLAQRTLERAKSELAIRSVLVGRGDRRLSYWLLPGQTLSDTVPPADGATDLEPWLAALREEYPPATPLDEL